MHGRFFEAFGKKDSDSRVIPEDVLQELNKRLPPNFKYFRRSDGNYEAIPNPDSALQDVVLKVDFDFEKEPQLAKLYSEIGFDKFSEYLFRAQKPIPIKNLKMGSGEKLEPIGKLIADPLSDNECEITNSYVYPSRFEKPHRTKFESPEGDVVEIEIQQVKYDSVTEVKSENVSYPALKIEIFQYSPLTSEDIPKSYTNKDQQVRINYAVLPKKAETVQEAVSALHIFRGLVDGTTKINDSLLSPQGNTLPPKPMQLEASVAFWETALQLEKKLNITFNPSMDLSSDDIQLFAELDVCMLQGKAIEWKHPFDHFHIGGFHPVAGGKRINAYIGSDNISYAFIEGPIKVSLMGAKFDFYSRSFMHGFVITDIEWNEIEKEGEVYISDSGDSPWILSRHYCTEQEAVEFRREIDARLLDGENKQEVSQ